MKDEILKKMEAEMSDSAEGQGDGLPENILEPKEEMNGEAEDKIYAISGNKGINIENGGFL